MHHSNMEIAQEVGSYTAVTTTGGDAALFNPEDAHLPASRPSFSDVCQTLSLGLLSASPTMLLVYFGANTSVIAIMSYVFMHLAVGLVCAGLTYLQSGVAARWIIGLMLLVIISAFKSGHLLASCDNMAIKAVLYAITALWECSNAVLIIGGKELSERYNIDSGHRDIILIVLAPCQVKFVQQNQCVEDGTICGLNYSLNGRFCKRTIHITACMLSLGVLYMFVAPALASMSVQGDTGAFILVELECLAIMASLGVVLLDIPSHLWQTIHDLLVPTPLFAPSSAVRNASVPKVVLPYGWIYSSKSTRDFWSRWSRPAMQLIRRLFYYPLGGGNRWYISIPITFLLNASTHFDLSYAIVGDKAEVFWLAIFGILALVSMLEVAGDKYMSGVNSDGNVLSPLWYGCIRAFLAHASLRLVLYIVVYKCFHTSFHDLFVRVAA